MLPNVIIKKIHILKIAWNGSLSLLLQKTGLELCDNILISSWNDGKGGAIFKCPTVVSEGKYAEKKVNESKWNKAIAFRFV